MAISPEEAASDNVYFREIADVLEKEVGEELCLCYTADSVYEISEMLRRKLQLSPRLTNEIVRRFTAAGWYVIQRPDGLLRFRKGS